VILSGLLNKVKNPAVLTRDWKDYFMIRFGVLNKEKALHTPSMFAGFFFVDKRFEISNLDLIREMAEIIYLDQDSFFIPK